MTKAPEMTADELHAALAAPVTHVVSWPSPLDGQTVKRHFTNLKAAEMFASTIDGHGGKVTVTTLPFDKAAFMIEALETLGQQYKAAGLFKKAFATFSAIEEIREYPDSLATLYDIIKQA